MTDATFSLWDLVQHDLTQAEEHCLSLPAATRDHLVRHQLIDVAVKARHEGALRLMGHTCSFTTVAHALAAAHEAHWTEGASAAQQAYLTASQVDGPGAQRATPYSLHLYALCTAIEAGWDTAIEPLLATLPEIRGDEQYKLNYEGNPLLSAVKQGRADLVERLVVRHPLSHVVDFSLSEAGQRQDHRMLQALWPHGRELGRKDALVRGAKPGWPDPEGEAWLVAQMDSVFQSFPDPKKEVRHFMAGALENHYPSIWIEHLIPLMGDQVSDNHSWALRCAVVHKHSVAVHLLLPFSDPQSARHKWVRRKKPAWDLVDQLGTYLPEDQQPAWCHQQELRLPQTTRAVQAGVAEKRATKALQEHTLPITPSRRRMRS